MNSISLCMIVKNEEKVLDNCLSTACDLVDEIIIVDTGSTDKTKEIARKYTDKIYDFKWIDDFAKARNFSFEKATKDYIMWLDADDIILEEDRKKFKEFKNSIDGTQNVYSLKYVCSRDEAGNPTIVIVKNRIVKREKNYKWKNPIHEYMDIKDTVMPVDIAITHSKKIVNDPNRNLRIFEKMKKEGKDFDIRNTYLYGKSLSSAGKIEQAITEFEKLIKENEKEYMKNRWYLYNGIIELANCYKIKQELKKELDSLFIILKNQIPTIEVLNKISDCVLRQKRYDEAIFWLEIAANIDDNSYTQKHDIFITYIKLGYCYYMKKDYKKAYETNEKAGKVNPHNNTYLKNKEIYEKYL